MIKFVLSGTLDSVPFSRTAMPIYSSLSIDKKSQDYHTVTTISGELTFYNKGAVNDYDFIKKCEAVSISNKITVELYVDDELKQTGFFYPYQCDFNDDRCTATVSINVDDKYTCLSNFLGREFNILDEVDAWGDYLIMPSVNLYTHTVDQEMVIDCQNYPSGLRPREIYGSSANTGLPFSTNQYATWNTFGYYLPFQSIAHLPLPTIVTTDGGCPYCITTPLNTTDHCNILSLARVIKSEYRLMEYIGLNTGLVDIYNAKVKTTWAWEYTITENNKTTYAQVLPTTGDGWVDYKQYYYKNILCTLWIRTPYYNNQTYHYRNTFRSSTFFVYELINPYVDGLTTETIWRGRGLTDTLEMFLEKSGCGLTLKSDFLLSNINPVTGLNNKLTHLQLNNCSDIKDPQSSEPATILNMSFGQILDGLTNLFNCYWFIDGDDFRIEHLSYFENGYSYLTSTQQIYDLTRAVERTTGKPELISTNKYSYNIDKIYSSEAWGNMNPVYYDFQNLQIYYDIITDNGEKKYITSFVTDLGGVLNFPSEYANAACVIVAIEQVVVDIVSGQTKWVAIDEVGIRSGFVVTNGHLCPANLFMNYWQNGRALISGEFLGDDKLFATSVNKRTQSLTIRDCNDVINVPNIVKTGLGTGTVVGTKYDLVKKVKTLDIEI
jgi:hypothetical protein